MFDYRNAVIQVVSAIASPLTTISFPTAFGRDVQITLNYTRLYGKS
jgi:hypothetical protein